MKGAQELRTEKKIKEVDKKAAIEYPKYDISNET